MAGRWWIVGLVPGLLMAVAVARADPLPIAGPFGYHTDDPTPIRVEFPNKMQPARSLVLHVPRSAILFVANYDSRETPVLPESITVDGTFRFGLAAPDGAPFGMAVEGWADSHHLSPREAGSELRSALAMADVLPIRAERTDEALFGFLLREPEGFKLVETEQFEGLVGREIRRDAIMSNGQSKPMYEKNYDDRIYFRGSSGDFFDYISCSSSNSHAIVFCDYYVRVSDLVLLKVEFVDFRFNGGRAFAAERMRMVVAAYCGYAQDRESARCVRASGMTHDAD